MGVHLYQAGILPGGADKVLPPEWLFFAPLCDSLGASGVDPTPTFTRASIATFTNGSKQLVPVASGVPRFAPQGILIEGQRTNLATYSEDFAQGSAVAGPWWRMYCTPVPNTIASPYFDGAVIADTILEHASNNYHGVYQNYAGVASQKDALTIFAKQQVRGWVVLDWWDSVTGGVEQFFNVATGAVGSKAEFGGATIVGAPVREYVDGWWKFSIVVQTVADTSRSFYFGPALSDGSGSYMGSAEIAGAHFMGAQIEVSVDFPSSYIPATGVSSVTRLQDKLSYPAANAPVGDGTLEAEITKYYQGTGGQGSALETVSNTYTQGARIMMLDTGRIRVQVYKGALEADVESGGLVYIPYVTYHAMGPFETNKVTLFVDGTRYGTDLSAAMPVAQNRISIGMDGNDVNPFYGWIKNVRLWESFRVPA